MNMSCVEGPFKSPFDLFYPLEKGNSSHMLPKGVKSPVGQGSVPCAGIELQDIPGPGLALALALAVCIAVLTVDTSKMILA